MKKLLVALTVALGVLTSAEVSQAAIFVRIEDGIASNAKDGRTLTRNADGSVTVGTATTNLRLRQLSPAPPAPYPVPPPDLTTQMNLLTCSTRPCTVFFPSGSGGPTSTNPQPLTGDTFKFQETCISPCTGGPGTSNLAGSGGLPARIEKFDSGASADRVSLRGVKITSVLPAAPATYSAKTLTVTYGVESLDLRTLTSTQSSSYTGTAALSGTFRTATGLRASACPAGTVSTDLTADKACLTLALTLNGTALTGNSSPTTTTVSLPCSSSIPSSTSPTNSCGSLGSWSSTGSFTGANDSQSLNCPSSCSPTQVGKLTAKFNGANEVLSLTSSAHGGMANISDESGGKEEVFLTFADELGGNRWVVYTAATERCLAVFKAPTINDTRNFKNNANIPASTELHCGTLAPLIQPAPPAPPVGVPLISLVDDKEDTVPGSAQIRNDAARVAFLPPQGQLQVKDLTVVSISHDVFVGTASSGDSRIGDVVFDDCSDGSLYLALELVDSDGVGMGTAKVYVGNADNGRSQCNGFESISLDLVNNSVERVDTSGLVPNLDSPCCITFQQLKQGQTGKLFVRKAAFVNDHGSLPLTTFKNHLTTFFDGNINGVTAAPFLEVVTPRARVTLTSTNGVSFVITKLTQVVNGIKVPLDTPVVVKVIRSQDITINGNKFTTTFNTNDIQADQGGTDYVISLCVSGAEDVDPSLPPNTPVGICIQNQALMTLL